MLNIKEGCQRWSTSKMFLRVIKKVLAFFRLDKLHSAYFILMKSG